MSEVPSLDVPDHCEVWSIRIPAHISLDELNRKSLNDTITIDGLSYSLQESTPDAHFRCGWKPFRRHYHLVARLEDSKDDIPDPQVPLRHAYAHVDQRQGLKVRWKPPGSGGGVVVQQQEGGKRSRAPSVVETNGKSHNKKRVKVDDDESPRIKQEGETPSHKNGSHKKHKKKKKKRHGQEDHIEI